MRNRSLVGLVVLLAVMVTGCGTTYRPVTGIPKIKTDAKMKVFSADSSNTIGQTTPQDNAVERSVTFVGTYIPGLNIQTAVLNAENTFGMRLKWGFPKGMYSYTYTGRIGNADDVVVMYSVNWDSPNKISSVDCHIQAAANEVSVSELKSVAIQYLGFVATLPYTGSQPSLAKKWIANAVRSDAKPNKYMIKRKFGKVNFYLDPYFVIQTPKSPKLIDAELTITPNIIEGFASEYVD